MRFQCNISLLLYDRKGFVANDCVTDTGYLALQKLVGTGGVSLCPLVRENDSLLIGTLPLSHEQRAMLEPNNV